MARVLTCVTFDQGTGQCTQEVWLEQSDWTHYLPTVDQANEVGAAFFTSVMIVAVAKRLLFPPEERELK
ncbi:hypothetical protein [Xanthomonas arboricola]|uniref:hypothetical protein n=1 Tax=Xanthomonas arboricola TaxID=56448 RepID=UPI000E1E8B0E|nr:hypothetical protein [Xanthomonas arboricola]